MDDNSNKPTKRRNKFAGKEVPMFVIVKAYSFV